MPFPIGKKYKFTDFEVQTFVPAEGSAFENLSGSATTIYIKLLFDEGFEEGEDPIFKYPVVKFIHFISETDYTETPIDVSSAYCWVDITGVENEIYMVYNFVDTYKSEEGEINIPAFGAGNYIFYNPTDHSDFTQVPYGSDPFDFEAVKKYAPWPMEVAEDAG